MPNCQCPKCHAEHAVSDASIGMRGKCPQCKGVFVLAATPEPLDSIPDDWMSPSKPAPPAVTLKTPTVRVNHESVTQLVVAARPAIDALVLFLRCGGLIMAIISGCLIVLAVGSAMGRCGSERRCSPG